MKTLKARQWIIFGIITLLCGGAAAGLYAMKPAPPQGDTRPVPIRRVSVAAAVPATYPSRIKAFGQVDAKWTTTVRAQVAGRIIRINEHLSPGTQLRTGTLILEIDPTDHRAELARTRMELENARLHLIQTQRRATQARSDWKTSGIGEAPSSPLVFHEPQLKAARARVACAEKSVDKALNDLAQTRITAPYDGVVAQRFADRGETLFAGDDVVELVSTKDVEIRVNLDSVQVQNMGSWQLREADIVDPATGRSWKGRLVRDGGLVDTKTRLRRFYLTPQPPWEGLVPGMFVTAVISGTPTPNLLALPESCLTRAGEIWVVDPDNRLRSRPASPAFYDNGQVYVPGGLNREKIRVVTAPAPGFINGAKVEPIIRKGS